MVSELETVNPVVVATLAGGLSRLAPPFRQLAVEALDIDETLMILSTDRLVVVGPPRARVMAWSTSSFQESCAAANGHEVMVQAQYVAAEAI